VVTSNSIDVLERLSPAVPSALAARADAWGDRDQPVAPSVSASVVLLREVDGELQTYLLHRHARMPFAASMVVFPGGRVDPSDGVEGVHPVRRCALRETEEETGVRLADADLHDWAHWVTPELEPRRYDTRFYVAALPDGQHARDISGETDRAAWTRPSVALAQFGRGELALMPPTCSILMELADASRLSTVLELAHGRQIHRVLPRLERTGHGWAFRYPQVTG
jgi:8-oxo-dGTP pyrophosphatase MutT (NUDIX family)